MTRLLQLAAALLLTTTLAPAQLIRRQAPKPEKPPPRKRRVALAVHARRHQQRRPRERPRHRPPLQALPRPVPHRPANLLGHTHQRQVPLARRDRARPPHRPRQGPRRREPLHLHLRLRRPLLRPRAACSGSTSTASSTSSSSPPSTGSKQGHPTTDPAAEYTLWVFPDEPLTTRSPRARPTHPPAALIKAIARWAAEPLPGSGIVQNITHAILVDPDGTPHEVAPSALGVMPPPAPKSGTDTSAPALKPRN